MRAIRWMQDLNCQVVFDATHSVQRPEGLAKRLAATGNLLRSWLVRLSQQDAMAFSLRHTKTQAEHFLTAPTKSLCEISQSSSPNLEIFVMRYYNLLLALLLSAFGSVISAPLPKVAAASPTPTPLRRPVPQHKIKITRIKSQPRILISRFQRNAGPRNQSPAPRRNGKLVMVLEAEVANKIDDSHVQMTNMKIDAFDEEGKKIYIECRAQFLTSTPAFLSGRPMR